MKNLLITATGMLAITIVVGSAFAQTPDEVIVEGARTVKTTIGHTASGELPGIGSQHR